MPRDKASVHKCKTFRMCVACEGQGRIWEDQAVVGFCVECSGTGNRFDAPQLEIVCDRVGISVAIWAMDLAGITPMARAVLVYLASRCGMPPHIIPLTNDEWEAFYIHRRYLSVRGLIREVRP